MKSKTLALACICLFIAACTTAQTPEAETITATPPTAAPSATDTPFPTATIRIPTAYPRNTLTWTPTPTPDFSPTPVPNPTLPITMDDTFENDLQAQGYTVYSVSSIEGPESHQYSAYLLLDSTFIYKSPPFPFREFQGSEGCWIAFYRSDAEDSKLLALFPAAKYPEGSFYAGYPVSCRLVDWDSSGNFYSYSGPGSDEQALVNAQGAWMDMNGNGLPEFSVVYTYCSFGCMDYGAMSMSVYEIQTTSTVVEITAGLPGIIEPIKGFIHSDAPLDFYFYDGSLEYCYKICIIETFWIYAWDGTAFIDVTSNYANEYREKGEQFLAWIEEDRKNGYFPEWHFLTILFHLEKAGLRDEAFEIFMEITDPGDWPDLDMDQLCWLQYARASISEDHELGQKYRMPDFRLDFVFLDPKNQLERLLPAMNTLKYDLTACQAVLENP